MQKLTKILLIGCIVLIAAIGLVTGMFYGNNLNTPAPLSSLNNTTTTNASISQENNTTVTSNETIMTPEEAMQRVDNELSGYYKATSAVLINGSPHSLYKVHIIHSDPNRSDYGKDGGYVTVDTVTGFVYHKGV